MLNKIIRGISGAGVIGVIGAIASGLALLIASQLFSGVSKANADIAELKTKEIVDIEALRKDVTATRAGIDVLLDLQGSKPQVLKYRVQYPNVAMASTTKK